MRSYLYDAVYSRLRGFPWASSWLGRHQIRFEYDQPFEVKNHGLQEGRKLILRHPAVAHPLWSLRKDPFIPRP